MNSYKFFNNWVYSYYITRNHQSELGTFAIDLEIYKQETRVSRLAFPEVRFGTWSKLLLPVPDVQGQAIPQYFGLIALQCYAAFMMEHDGNLRESVYRKRFVEIAHLNSEFELDNYFKEDYQSSPIQEVIWERATRHFVDLGIQIQIPKPSSGANRYVQFPKSQIVLNKEDLKEYIPLFNELKDNIDQISFGDFQKYFLNKQAMYANAFKRPNNKHNELDPVKSMIKKSQIFNFYNSPWEESYIYKKTAHETVKKNYAIAWVEDGVVELFNGSYQPIEIEVLSLHRPLFFKKSTCEMEYEMQNSLHYGEEFLVCFVDGKNSIGRGESLVYKNTQVLFIRITLTYSDFKGSLSNFIVEPFPVLVTGLRIGRKRQFLFGLGPIIIPNSEKIEYALLQNGNLLSMPLPEILGIGKYRLRTPRFSDFFFEVVDAPRIIEPVISTRIGRSLKDFSITDRGDRVEGMIFRIEMEHRSVHTVNNWIKSHNSRTIPGHYSKKMRQILTYLQYRND